jgi:hypothetical protein
MAAKGKMVMGKILIAFFPKQQRFLIIDDTIIYRNSKKAPGSKINHEHGCKANRPKYVRGQSWVSLASVVNQGLSFWMQQKYLFESYSQSLLLKMFVSS